MKKRLITILLTICMVASLFTGMTVTAHADKVMETIEYTLKEGENVYIVCQRLEIDFHANYEWITKTNNITNYSSLPVGRKITLPLGLVEDPAATTTPETQQPATSTTIGTAGKLLEGDKIVSFLIPHVVAHGETLYDLCIKKGIAYNNENIDYILKLNNLKNANRIAVGRTLLFPSATAPASGSCIAVVSHDIVKGDATYNLCASYGISYKDNLELMKVLNKKTDMATIKVGQDLLIPVPATITATTNPGNSGNSGNTGNSGNSGNSGDADNKDEVPETPAVSYKIVQNSTNANHGSYNILVNNKSQSTAVKGDTVTINVKPKTGYALDYIKVLDKDGKSVSLNETTFTMPESDVTIDVIFVSSKQYKITSEYSVNGSYIITVNGVETTYASEGQTVKIVPTPAYNYELDKINWRSSTGTVKNDVLDKQFVMPAYDVTVSVAFRNAGTYAINKGTATNGSFEIKNNGKAVSKAKAGMTIDVLPTANEGYEVKEIRVVPTDTSNKNTVSVVNGSFEMPEYAVSVYVDFKPLDFEIKSSASSNGSFSVVNGSNEVISSADTASGVYIKPVPADGYVIDKVSYNSVDGEVTVNKTGDHYYFAMPASDITVSVTFKARLFYLAAHTASPAVTFTVDGKDASSAYMGKTVTVNAHAANGVEAKEIKVLYTSTLASKGVEREVENVTVTKNSDGTFKFDMPASNVTIKAVYELEDIDIGKASTSNGSFSFKLNDANGNALSKAKMGQKIYVDTVPATGYHTASISVVDANGKSVTVNSSARTFEMPSTKPTVTVVFEKTSYDVTAASSTGGSISFKLKDANGKAITQAKMGETVYIVSTPDSGYRTSGYTVVDAKGNNVTVNVSGNTFVMPASNVTVTASYAN